MPLAQLQYAIPRSVNTSCDAGTFGSSRCSIICSLPAGMSSDVPSFEEVVCVELDFFVRFGLRLEHASDEASPPQSPSPLGVPPLRGAGSVCLAGPVVGCWLMTVRHRCRR